MTPEELARQFLILKAGGGQKPQAPVARTLGDPDVDFMTPENMEAWQTGGAMAAGGPVGMAGRAMLARPFMTGAAAGATAMLAPSAMGQDNTEGVKALQREMQDAGYYSGKIDGRMGPETKAAKAAYDQQQARMRELQAQEAAAKAAGDQAAAAKAEADRQAQAAEIEARRKEAGDTRLQEMDADLPAWQKALREYGPYLGYAAGWPIGHRAQSAVIRSRDELARIVAGRADNVMSAGARGDVPSRIGRVNQFWSGGQRGTPEAPFVSAPQRKPYPFAANPDAPEASALYQQGAAGRFGPMAAVPAVGGAEYGATELLFIQPLHEEVRAAEEAVNAEPSEANIQRLQSAKDKLAGAEFFGNIGRGVALGSAAPAAMDFVNYDPARPNTDVAEAERGRLARLLVRRRP